MLVRGDHIQVAVIVQVKQSDAVVLAVGGAERLAVQQIFVEPFLGFAEVEELHFPAKSLVRVVNELQQLFGANPAVRVENKREGSLLEQRRFKRCLPIGNGLRAIGAVGVVGFPITGNHRRKFPAEFADHIRIRIILNRGAKPLQAQFGDAVRFGWKVFSEPFAALGTQHQLAGQRFIVRSGEVHDRGINCQKLSCGTDPIENFSVKTRTGTVHRIAAGHPKGERFIARNAIQQIHAVVVIGRGRDEVAVRQQRAGMGERVNFQ